MQIKPQIIVLICLLCALIAPVSAINWSYNYTFTSTSVDIVNSTYMKDWMYYLMVTNKTTTTGAVWELPVIGFAMDAMGPFTDAFKGMGDPTSGMIVYLILFGIFMMMVWRQTGTVTIPAMIMCITGGAWGMLLPESAWPWCLILMAAAIAAQLTLFLTTE